MHLILHQQTICSLLILLPQNLHGACPYLDINPQRPFTYHSVNLKRLWLSHLYSWVDLRIPHSYTSQHPHPGTRSHSPSFGFSVGTTVTLLWCRITSCLSTIDNFPSLLTAFICDHLALFQLPLQYHEIQPQKALIGLGDVGESGLWRGTC